MNYVECGKQEGATVITGGKRHGKTGYFIEPVSDLPLKYVMGLLVVLCHDTPSHAYLSSLLICSYIRYIAYCLAVDSFIVVQHPFQDPC